MYNNKSKSSLIKIRTSSCPCPSDILSRALPFRSPLFVPAPFSRRPPRCPFPTSSPCLPDVLSSCLAPFFRRPLPCLSTFCAVALDVLVPCALSDVVMPVASLTSSALPSRLLSLAFRRLRARASLDVLPLPSLRLRWHRASLTPRARALLTSSFSFPCPSTLLARCPLPDVLVPVPPDGLFPALPTSSCPGLPDARARAPNVSVPRARLTSSSRSLPNVPSCRPPLRLVARASRRSSFPVPFRRLRAPCLPDVLVPVPLNVPRAPPPAVLLVPCPFAVLFRASRRLRVPRASRRSSCPVPSPDASWLVAFPTSPLCAFPTSSLPVPFRRPHPCLALTSCAVPPPTALVSVPVPFPSAETSSPCRVSVPTLLPLLLLSL
ncbi:hypothetical protein TYRP_007106 [Tyrophagus putrescentiae]|nr:hypothetical protein TYRP_007106 [Tyrophagus putrescentiae]